MATVIWNDKEARWVLRVTVNGKTHKFSSREPGLAGKRAVLSAAREFNAHGTRNATVAEIREEWLESIAARLGRSSVPYVQAESLTRLYVVPVFGRRRIRDLKLRDWQSCINDARPVSGSGFLSKKYLSNLRAQINLFIRYAYENEYTEPLRGSLYVPNNRPVIGKEALTLDEVRTLLVPSDNWYWPAWALMLLTGARPGEIYGLMVEDYDGLSITIRRAINARGMITKGKNKNAQRVIPLHPIARQIINDTIERNAYLNTPWIFPGKSGGRCYPQTAAKEWRVFASSRGLLGTPYCLRHTFVSLVKNTMPDSLLKNIVGHSQYMDTVGTYGHKMANDDSAALEYIERAFPS